MDRVPEPFLLKMRPVRFRAVAWPVGQFSPWRFFPLRRRTDRRHGRRRSKCPFRAASWALLGFSRSRVDFKGDRSTFPGGIEQRLSRERAKLRQLRWESSIDVAVYTPQGKS